MLLRFFRKICLVVSTVALAACGQTDLEERGPIVLAAASMQGALEDVADAWEARGHARPVLSFSATPAIARQIEQGVPADLVITADAEWMTWLDERDLVARESSYPIIRNRLVLVARPDGSGPRTLAALSNDQTGARLALAETQSVPAGRYARSALTSMKLWDAVQDRVVPAENVRGALARVERGEVELAVVYASDAAASDAVQIVQEIPARHHQDIMIFAASLTAGDHHESEELLLFLGSDEARSVFLTHGFEPLS